MNQFPVLPVLEQLKKYADKNKKYENIYIVAVQHILETTGSLFEAIIHIGIKPNNIHLIGKIYSTNIETKDKLKRIGINVYNNKRSLNFGTVRENFKKDVNLLWT